MLRVSLLVLTLLSLSGCLDLGGGGGGSDEPAPSSDTEVITAPDADVPPGLTPPAVPGPPLSSGPTLPPVAPPAALPAFAEPTAAVVDELEVKGFYDTDKDGNPRAVRNDLVGTLPAMIQFVQSHSVDPAGNEAKNMPRLTAEKEALLLVTPDPTLAGISSVSVEVLINGARQGVLNLRHPDEIYRSDYNNGDGRPDYVYSRKAWSAVLPWNWVTGDTELRVTDNAGRSGVLSAAAIEIAPPGELLMQSIRIGMLTTPPGGNHWFRTNPAEAATDYLQTIPAAKIVASYYEDIALPEVMVASGTIYTDASAGNGDVYSGDMRENTGKATFSVGINLANWGVTSSGMQAQNQPQVTQSVVAHHAQGVYANGRHAHGLSGGNSILTLYSSSGNEYSHEIGHHYGLGHYPGQQGDNYFWSAHHHDSGWGYISYRKRMRANLHWGAGKNGGLNGTPVFDDNYSFAPDSMAGGSFSSSLSRYTHYTGYSTKIKIQEHFNRAMWSEESPTGYVKWNAASKKMEPHAPVIPNQNVNWFNSADGKFLRPRLFGVPVVTLLGGYDPENNDPDVQKALIYPALRGNWGYVYDLPETAVVNNELRQCWMQVDFVDGKRQKIAVAGKRMQNNLVNKFHINLAQSDKPARAELFCQTPGATPESLYAIDIPTDLAPMPPAVVVGKEAGHSAIRAVELPALQTALEGISGQAVLNLNGNSRVLFESHGDNLEGLSATAREVAARLREQDARMLRLNRWLDQYGQQLQGNVAAREAFTDLLSTLKLPTSSLLPSKQTFTRSNGDCIKIEPTDSGGWAPVVIAKAQCTGGPDEQWMLDVSNRIRSVAQPTLCLTHGGSASMTACSLRNDAQAWEINDVVFKRGGSCLDLKSGYLTNGRGTLIGYQCTGGQNQKWYGLSSNDAPVITLLQNRNIAAFIDYAEASVAAD